MEKRQNKTIYRHPCSILGPSARWFFLYLFDDILTPPYFDLQRKRLLLEVRQIANLSTHTEKASLRVSEDRGMIACRMESVESSVVLVILRKFAAV